MGQSAHKVHWAGKKLAREERKQHKGETTKKAKTDMEGFLHLSFQLSSNNDCWNG